MGDGRYYTWIQFTKILYYTILCMVLVFGIVYLNTKSRKRRTLKYLLAVKGSILLMTVLRFYEELVFDVGAAEMFRKLQMYIALIVFSLIVQLLYGFSKRNFVALLGLWHLLLVGIFLNFNQDILLEGYTYGHASYHGVYKVTVALFSLMILIGTIKNMRYNHHGSRYERLQKRYISLSLCIPTLFYTLFIYDLMPKDVQIFYGVLIVSSITLLAVFVKYTPGELLPLNFIQLVDDIRETVIVFDKERQVIYNNKTDFASRLTLESNDTAFSYRQLFSQFQIIAKEELGHETRYTLKENNRTFHICCKQKTIEKGKQVLGYLLVLEDYSHLEEMLSNLRHQTEELNTINESLKEHAAVVATIEAERERHRLMLEVQNYLGHRFAEMTKVIENIIGSTQTESTLDVVKAIEASTKLAKDNLKDIRKTVVDYRSSYE